MHIHINLYVNWMSTFVQQQWNIIQTFKKWQTHSTRARHTPRAPIIHYYTTHQAKGKYNYTLILYTFTYVYRQEQNELVHFILTVLDPSRMLPGTRKGLKGHWGIVYILGQDVEKKNKQPKSMAHSSARNFQKVKSFEIYMWGKREPESVLRNSRRTKHKK